MVGTTSAVDVVNIAASGDIGVQIDIEQLVEDVDLPVANFDPQFNAVFMRFEEDRELIILYTSGKYILRGGDDFDRMQEVNQRFLEMLRDLGISLKNPVFEVKNVVCVGDLQQDLDLNTVMIGLGMERTEYEPEQFPGLVYRPEDSRCTLLIFGSGKVVITGGHDGKDNQEAFDRLAKRIQEFTSA